MIHVMSADEHDVGLNQRLPWGGLQPEPARPLRRAAPAPVPAATPAEPEPAPAPAQAPEPEPVAADTHQEPGAAAPPPAVVDTGAATSGPTVELQRSIEVLLVVLEGRMDRIEERLDVQGSLIPAFLGELENRMQEQPAAWAEHGRRLDQISRQLEERIDAVAAQLNDRIERLQTLVVASHTTLIDAVEGLAVLVAEAKPADLALDG